MGIKFGEIDSNQILVNEFRIGVLEKLLEEILNSNPDLKKPSEENVKRIMKMVVDDLRKRYPNSDVKLTDL